MTFTTRSGRTIDLDEIEAITVRANTKPAPADDPIDPLERRIVEQEMRDYSTFPFEVVADIGDGELHFYGEQAKQLARAWFQSLTPWLNG